MAYFHVKKLYFVQKYVKTINYLNMMKNRSTYPAGSGLLVLGALVIVSALVFSFVGGIIGAVIFGEMGINMGDLSNIDANKLSYLKFLQLVTAIGTFLVPPLLFARIDKGLGQQWGFKTKLNYGLWLIGGLAMVVALPLVSASGYWNQQLSLPDAFAPMLDWMKRTEEMNNGLMEAFLNTSTFGGLLVNLFIVAVLPAFGEELLFRGGIQPLIGRAVKNKHLAILITAFLFSAIHMQFLTFLPRFLMGIYLGYLFVWGKSLWYPILAHFVNNALAVVLYFMYHSGRSGMNPDQMGTAEGIETYSLVLSMVLLIGMVYYLKKQLLLFSGKQQEGK